MSDYQKIKKQFNKKTNVVDNDFKGAFALKVHDPRKEDYKRKRMKVNDYYDEPDSEEKD